jgi:MIT (microtubule interacting and transport) domain
MATTDSQTAATRKAYHKQGGSRSFSTDMRPSAMAESSSRSSGGNVQQKDRDRERKTMLSRALQKAHQAVLLDNAGNFEGAIDSYGDACELLHQVLIRSTADEERRKLDQIVSQKNDNIGLCLTVFTARNLFESNTRTPSTS